MMQYIIPRVQDRTVLNFVIPKLESMAAIYLLIFVWLMKRDVVLLFLTGIVNTGAIRERWEGNPTTVMRRMSLVMVRMSQRVMSSIEASVGSALGVSTSG